MEALLVRRTRLEECVKNWLLNTYDQMQAISCPVPGGAGNPSLRALLARGNGLEY